MAARANPAISGLIMATPFLCLRREARCLRTEGCRIHGSFAASQRNASPGKHNWMYPSHIATRISDFALSQNERDTRPMALSTAAATRALFDDDARTGVRVSRQDEPRSQGCRLLLGPPRPADASAERCDCVSQRLFRPLQDAACLRVKVALAPDRARQLATVRRILYDTAKQLALERVNSNVIVRDERRIDQAAHDNASALHGMPNGAIPSNRVGDRLASESLHGTD